nr:MAG TPA: hypothetical protein [Caudoviricetes sp.]
MSFNTIPQITFLISFTISNFCYFPLHSFFML